MYGKRRSGSQFGKKRTLGTLSANRIVSMVKKGIKISNAGQKARFATVGFARNVEKKYWDKTYQGAVVEAHTGAPGGDPSAQGVMYISDGWRDYNFSNATGAPVVTNNDFNKGLVTGTTARSRIANKIKPIYYKGAFTFTAAQIDATNTTTQNGEMYGNLAVTTKYNYLRTTYRMVIVKDLQVNSTDSEVKWSQVFETSSNLTAGLHSELSIDNMGRFIVLEDKYFTVDADSPQKTVPFHIAGSKVGNIRYNGPSATALTDKGVYIIFSAYVMGVNEAVLGTYIRLPNVVGHTRLCFTDD